MLGANATWKEKRDVYNGSWQWLLTCPHWVLVPASLAGHIRGTWGRHRLLDSLWTPFLPWSGAEVSTDAYWDCPAGNFRCFCPWARTPLWLRRNRKQNLTLSASLLVPRRGTGGLQSGVTLRRSGRPLKLCGSTGARGSAWAIKETLYIKALPSFLLEQTQALASFCIHKASLWRCL